MCHLNSKRSASSVKSSEQPRNLVLFYHDLRMRPHRLREVMGHVQGQMAREEEMGSGGDNDRTVSPVGLPCFLMVVDRDTTVPAIFLVSGRLGENWGTDMASSISCRLRETVQEGLVVTDI